MKTNLLNCLFFLGLFNFLGAQENTVTEVLQSTLVKNELNVYLQNGKIKIDIDGEKKETLGETTFLQAKNTKTIGLTGQFFNPLKYRVSITQNEKEDPNFAAADKVINSSIIPFTGGIGFDGAISKASETANLNVSGRILTNNGNQLQNANQTNINYNITNPELAELFAFIKVFDPIFETKAENEKYLQVMQDFTISQTITDLEASLKTLFENLVAINSFDLLELKIAVNGELQKTIDDEIKSLENSFISLNIALNNLKKDVALSNNSIVSIIDKRLNNLQSQIKNVKSIKETAIKHYVLLEKPFLSLAKNVYGNETSLNQMELADVNIPARRKLNEVTLKVTKYDFDLKSKTLTEKETKSYKMIFRRYSFLVPKVSSGILFTDLSFPSFGTDLNEDGETIISRGEDKESEISVATYLDFHFNSLNELPVFLQLGVGPSKEKPLLFTGIGIDIIDRINLSGGVLFTWFPELNELSVGDMVSGTTAIEDDISFSFSGKPKFYFGISIDLSKK